MHPTPTTPSSIHPLRSPSSLHAALLPARSLPLAPHPRMAPLLLGGRLGSHQPRLQRVVVADEQHWAAIVRRALS